MPRMNRISSVVLPAFMGAALFAAPALAQTTTTPVVNADSMSTTNTTQGNAQNMVFNSAQPLGRSELVTTPDAIAPSIAGGNPCVISASMGVSGMGFGISGGLGVQDPECETRQQVALLVNMGAIDVAIARFCMEAEVREAFRLAGRPCPNDTAVAKTAAAQPSVVQPAAAQVVAPALAQRVKTISAAAQPAPKDFPSESNDVARSFAPKTYDATHPGDEGQRGQRAFEARTSFNTTPELRQLQSKRFKQNLQVDQDR